jgi:hypothetical protein
MGSLCSKPSTYQGGHYVLGGQPGAASKQSNTRPSTQPSSYQDGHEIPGRHLAATSPRSGTHRIPRADTQPITRPSTQPGPSARTVNARDSGQSMRPVHTDEQVASNPQITRPRPRGQDIIDPSKSRAPASRPDPRQAAAEAAERRQKEVCKGKPCLLVTRLTGSLPPGQNASRGTNSANPNRGRLAAQLEAQKSKASPNDTSDTRDERLVVSTSLLDNGLSLFADDWWLVGLSWNRLPIEALLWTRTTYYWFNYICLLAARDLCPRFYSSIFGFSPQPKYPLHRLSYFLPVLIKESFLSVVSTSHRS